MVKHSHQKCYLFVYGTLQSHFENEFAKILGDTSLLKGKGYLNGALYRVSWYPAAVWDVNSIEQVWGEIYEVHTPETLFPILDEYEGIPETDEYVRRQIPIYYDEQILTCWTYLYIQSVSQLQQIKSGIFRG